MKTRLMVTITILCSINAFAQPDSLWSRMYGRMQDEDYCNAIWHTDDGGYMLAGRTWAYDEEVTDLLLVKTASNGDSLWSRTYGRDEQEFCTSALRTTDNGVLLAGQTLSYGAGFWDYYVVRTNANGDTIWTRSYGGTGADFCTDAIETSDGGFILAGRTESFGVDGYDYWVVRLNTDGDSLWTRTYGGAGDQECESICQTSDGGFALLGATSFAETDTSDFWLIRTDPQGDTLWTRSFGSSSGLWGTVIRQTADGGLILAGIIYSYSAHRKDVLIIKTDTNGDSLWSRTYGGWYDEHCNDIQQTPDGGYLFAGWTYSYGNGNHTNPNAWLVRLDANGDSLWSLALGGNGREECTSFLQEQDGSYSLAGMRNESTENTLVGDFWLVKTGPDPVTDVSHYSVTLPNEISLSAYPNPFNSEMMLNVTGFTRDVRVTLHNLLGQEVDVIHVGQVTGASLHYAAPASLSSGLYFVRATDARNVKTVKVVYLK